MRTNLFSSFGSKALRAAQAGFTMIELLVVIAVIGVLSVVVLSSINPIEQINKGRDTRARSDAAQLVNAVDRYFSIAEQYPWNVVSDTYTNPSVEEYDDAFVFDESGEYGVTADETTWPWVDILVENNEVKAGFTNRLKTDENVQYLVSKGAGANASMYVCFRPSSNAFQQEAMEACEDANSEWPSEACNTACTGGDAASCLTCIP